MVRGSGRLGDAAGDHHDQQRRLQRAAHVPGQQAATVVTADNSRNQGVAFDGLLTDGFNPATSLLCTGIGVRHGGDRHISHALGSRLDRRNRQYADADVEHLSAVADGDLRQRAGAEEHHGEVPDQRSGPLVRYNVDASQSAPYEFTASGVVRWYYNPFTGVEIPMPVHPDLPPGTILAYCERLPAWYQSNETPNVAEVLTRRDYYRVDWPVRTRRREFGVYTEEVLAIYASFGIGIITNIGNG